LNIVCLEAADLDGTPNANKPNGFNDLRLVLTLQDGKPVILGKWEGTTEPASSTPTLHSTPWAPRASPSANTKPGAWARTEPVLARTKPWCKRARSASTRPQ